MLSCPERVTGLGSRGKSVVCTQLTIKHSAVIMLCYFTKKKIYFGYFLIVSKYVKGYHLNYYIVFTVYI